MKDSGQKRRGRRQQRKKIASLSDFPVGRIIFGPGASLTGQSTSEPDPAFLQTILAAREHRRAQRQEAGRKGGLTRAANTQKLHLKIKQDYIVVLQTERMTSAAAIAALAQEHGISREQVRRIVHPHMLRPTLGRPTRRKTR